MVSFMSFDNNVIPSETKCSRGIPLLSESSGFLPAGWRVEMTNEWNPPRTVLNHAQILCLL